MFDRTEKKVFLDSEMSDRASEIVDGDEYAFIYAHEWLYPDSLNWRIIGAPKKIDYAESFTFIYSYPKDHLSVEEVL